MLVVASYNIFAKIDKYFETKPEVAKFFNGPEDRNSFTLHYSHF